MPQFPIIHTGAKPRMLALSSFQDFSRNTFIGMCYYDDENQYNGGVLIYKVTPGGDVSEVARIAPTIGKGDSCTIVQVGVDIQAYLSVHVGDAQAQLQALPPVRNVCVAWPQSVQPHGQEGAFLAPEVPQEPQLTKQEIAEEVIRQLGPLFAAFKADLVGNMKSKSKAGVAELTDPAIHDTDADARKYQDATYTRLDNILYEYFGQKPYPRPTEPQDGVQEQEKAT